jgi:TonB family protein
MSEPLYPSRARQLKKGATVLLKVLVATDGKVLDAQPVIDKPDPMGFVKAALRSARGAKFQPATTDGVPTQMWTTLVIVFKL